MPLDPQTLFRRALALHQQGQVQQAVPLYQQVLRLDPRHVGALANLGHILRRLGRPDEALALYERALALEPNNPDLLFNRANTLRDRGRLTEAVAGYRAALRLRPSMHQAHFNLGHALRDLGQIEDAADCFRETVKLQPQSAGAHTNLGNLLRRLGQLDEAVACHRRAIAADPNLADAYMNLGNVLLDKREIAAGLDAYRAAVRLRPGNAGWWLRLGNALARAGRQAEAVEAFRRASAAAPERAVLRAALEAFEKTADYSFAEADKLRGEGDALQGKKQLREALDCYRQALERNPLSAEAHNATGVARQALGEYAAAEAAFRAALELDPDNAAAHSNLGLLLDQVGRHPDAAPHLERAVALQPGLVIALVNLANFYKRAFRLEEAAAVAQRALARQPDDPGALLILGNTRHAQCLPDEALALFRRVQELQPDSPSGWANMLLALTCNDQSDPHALAAEHRAYGDRLLAAAGAQPPPKVPDEPDRKLRVGYVSADLCRHPVGYFIEPLLAHHDPGQVEVYCYYVNTLADDLNRHLRGLVPNWRDAASWSVDELARRIRADGIDLLVDLNGHTALSRLPVFARRPAPVQLSYLGYPFTIGLKTIDYLLADAVACPPEFEDLYSETVYRLAGGYLCFRPHPELPAVGPLPAKANGRVTFGSFNHAPKLSATTVALYARVLQAVPNSRLLLMAGPFQDPATRQRIRQRFVEHGVAADRVELRGPAVLPDYLAAYHRVDIALDPLPYNGGTTTCETLLMGVPVLTLPGKALFGRMGASILTSLGLPEFIADSPDDYVARAAAWAGDLDRLAELRASLRPRFLASPLGNAPAFARKVEAAYRDMWRRACVGEGHANR